MVAVVPITLFPRLKKARVWFSVGAGHAVKRRVLGLCESVQSNGCVRAFGRMLGAQWPRVRCAIATLGQSSIQARRKAGVAVLVASYRRGRSTRRKINDTHSRAEKYGRWQGLCCTRTHIRTRPGPPLPLDRIIDPNRLFFFGESPGAPAPPSIEPLPKPAYLPPWLGGRSADRASFLPCRPAKYASLLAALSSSSCLV